MSPGSGIEDILEDMRSSLEALFNQVLTQIVPAGRAIATLLLEVNNNLKQFNTGVKQAGETVNVELVQKAKKTTAGLGDLVAALNPTKILSGLTGSHPRAYAMGGMAINQGGMIGGLLGPLQQLSSSVSGFVQALNPNLMRLFNQALRDLMATFGTALAPVIQHTAAIFNELSSTLAPAMHALTPIIDNLMSVLEGSLVPIVGMLADAFVALSPIIELVTSIMASVAETMRVVYTVFRSALQVLYDVIKQMFGGVDLKDTGNQIREALQQLTKYFVQFAAYVAKALGYLDPFAKALEKNLRDLEGKRPGVKAAPENIHVSGLEQISKDLAVAAYAAQAAGGTRKKSEAEFLEELIKEVQEVQKNSKTLEQFLDEMKDKLLKGFMEDLDNLWAKFLAWWSNSPLNPVEPIRSAAHEAERRRSLDEQQNEMRRRGVPGVGPANSPSFWDNLFSS